MATHSVTLSRVHKIIERLQALAIERFEEAHRLSSPVSVRALQTDAQRERVRSRRSEVMELFAQGRQMLEKAAELREVVARENSARGISKLLAQQDLCNKLIQRYGYLMSGYSSANMQLEDLADISLDTLGSSDERLTVAVNVFSAQDVKAIDAELTALRTRVFALSDAIAELNACRVSIELPDELASQVLGG